MNGAAISTSNRFPHHFPKSSTIDDSNTGFSHGAYTSNQHTIGGYGDRHPRRANLASINTGPLGQPSQQSLHDMASPGTAFDMNFTPLLPSQLLLGSPFQPGSPSTFASPQFTNLGSFQQHNAAAHQHNQHTNISSPAQNQQSGISPSIYQNLLSPGGYSSSQLLGAPQSPTGNLSSVGLGSQGFGGPAVQVGPGMINGMSRTVYLGNIPAETSAEEILSHVRSGQIESVRLLQDKNCAFISFLDGSAATHFHSDAILKKLSIRGQDIKIGWGKPTPVPTSVALAVQQSGASRNVYLGNIPEEVNEVVLREELGKFGPIDTVKIVREKAIGFVHFLSIGNAIKAVSQLPQDSKWQAPRRVYYGKDRCAYVSKTQQQNAAQYLGIAPGYSNALNGADRDLISNALAQQSIAAAAVATTAGGVNNLGNRTVYLGNIHPETTVEEICNVVRGGLLHHIRYIPDKHICFVTFIDPTSAAAFYALSNMQGLMIHNRRLKIGWGKHSGALPPAVALAVSGGASRNVYIGNLDESWTEERLRQDFSEYGEIELVNALREKSCAFVNFTNIANAIKAIEAVRGREDYRRFKINFGKDRCGNPPRQSNNNHQHQHQQHAQQQQLGLQSREDLGTGSPINGHVSSLSQNDSSTSPTRTNKSPAANSTISTKHNGAHSTFQPQHGPTPSAILNAGNNNPLTMYLNQLSTQQVQQEQDPTGSDLYTVAALQQQQQHVLSNQQAALYGTVGADLLNGSTIEPPQQQQQMNLYDPEMKGPATSTSALGGLLAPMNGRSQHARAVSMPVFTQEIFGAGNAQTQQQQQQQQPPHHSQQIQKQPIYPNLAHRQQQSSFGGIGSGLGGFNNSGFGLAIHQSDSRGLSRWAEETVQ